VLTARHAIDPPGWSVLRESYATLEHKVGARTRDLAGALGQLRAPPTQRAR
jgi:hypothetical protein